MRQTTGISMFLCMKGATYLYVPLSIAEAQQISVVAPQKARPGCVFKPQKEDMCKLRYSPHYLTASK